MDRCKNEKTMHLQVHATQRGKKVISACQIPEKKKEKRKNIPNGSIIKGHICLESQFYNVNITNSKTAKWKKKCFE
jgi:hypothetical protein